MKDCLRYWRLVLGRGLADAGSLLGFKGLFGGIFISLLALVLHGVAYYFKPTIEQLVQGHISGEWTMPSFVDEIFMVLVWIVVPSLMLYGACALVFTILSPSKIHREQEKALSDARAALDEEKAKALQRSSRPKVSIAKSHIEQAHDKADVFLDVENTGDVTNRRTRIQIKDCGLLGGGSPSEWRRQLIPVSLGRKLPQDTGAECVNSFETATCRF